MGTASFSIAVTFKKIWMRKDRMGGIPNRVIVPMHRENPVLANVIPLGPGLMIAGMTKGSHSRATVSFPRRREPSLFPSEWDYFTIPSRF